MLLTVELLSGDYPCGVRVLGKILTTANPTEQFPLSVLEHVRIYSKSTHRLNFGDLDPLLDKGIIKMFIPPNFDIRSSAQLRALDVRGALTFDTQAGAPIGYRGGIAFGAGLTVTDDKEKNAVLVEATGGGVGDVNWQEEAVPVATRDTADFTGNVAVTDDPLNAKVIIHVPEGGDKRMIPFTYLDFPGTFVDIEAPIPAGATIQRVQLEITGTFSAGVRAMVGDQSVHDRLMDEFDSDLTEVAVYEASSTHTYGTSVQLRVYFVGTPAAGSGQVIVHFE